MGGSAVFAAEPIAIGSIASLTGYLSDQAQNVVEGMELGIEEINGKGGFARKTAQALRS
jgi:ABC-type branched-subunit amino acid transport system substrate-binding protein